LSDPDASIFFLIPLPHNVDLHPSDALARADHEQGNYAYQRAPERAFLGIVRVGQVVALVRRGVALRVFEVPVNAGIVATGILLVAGALLARVGVVGIRYGV